MIKGFKEFLMRGNVVDLAVAVIIGAAFTKIVTAFSDGIIGGLLAAVGGVPNFDAMKLTLNGADIAYGSVLTALINFLIVAGVVYFIIVMPMNKLAERRRRGIEEEPSAPSEEVLVLQEIRDELRRR